MNHRDRLIRFIRYAKGNPKDEWFPWVHDVQISLDDLSEDCLARMAENIRWGFWHTRKINRENRAIWAARRTA